MKSDSLARYRDVKDEDIVDCPRCLAEGRGNYPISPAVGHCRRCGYVPWTPPAPEDGIVERTVRNWEEREARGEKTPRRLGKGGK